MKCSVCGHDHEATTSGCPNALKMIDAGSPRVMVVGGPADRKDRFPLCPICRLEGTLVVSDCVHERLDGKEWQGQVAECEACMSQIPLPALRAWQARRQDPALEQLRRAAALIRQGFSMLDEGRQILEEQTGP